MRCEVLEVRQEPAALGGNGFRMKLHAPLRACPMAYRHHHAVLGPGRGPDSVRQGLVDAQRVIPHRDEILRQTVEQLAVVVPDPGEMTVPRPRRGSDRSPGTGRDGLVAHAYAQHGQARLGQNLRHNPNRAKPADVPARGETTKLSNSVKSIARSELSSLCTTKGRIR